MSSSQSQSDVRLENCESRARRVLPNTLIASQRGSVTLLRLSRLAKRNALDDPTIAGIESFFSDPPKETRAIVLHREGKHFSAGADLSAVTDIRPPASIRDSRSWHRAFDRIENAMCRLCHIASATSAKCQRLMEGQAAATAVRHVLIAPS